MNKLQAGFARVNITPMLGIPIAGYYKVRIADGVLDDLYVTALALACDDVKTVLLSVDMSGLNLDFDKKVRPSICDATGLPADAIYIHATHTHTGPALMEKITKKSTELQAEYVQFLIRRMTDASVMALADLKPAKMGYRVSQAPNVAFVRRFRMKDGSVRTNPGVNHPEILHPIGDVDQRVNVLRFDRGSDSIVLANFGNHPDTIGGNKISADWPGLSSRMTEQAIPGTKCIFFNGAQGDVNHVNVFPKSGDLNDTINDFDDVSRGYGHARYIARVVTGAIMQVYDKVQYVDVDQLKYARKFIRVPSNMPAADEIEQAHYINDMHNSGRDAELPYEGMMLTTMVARAARMVLLENGPEYFELPISALAIGNLAMIGFPGEPFTGIGRAVKEAEGWDLVLPTCITNGYQGYFPMKEAYDEGGYEAGSSKYKAGVAELFIEEGKKLLSSLREG